MIKGMTKRDKQLLYGLGLFVLLFLILEVCYNLNRRNEELEDRAGDLEAQYEAQEVIVQRLPMLIQEQSVQLEEEKQITQFLFQPMKSFEAERYFTDTVKQNGLSMLEISVNQAESVTLQPYFAVRTEEDKQLLGDGIIQWNIGMQIKGNSEAVLKMLDSWIQEEKALHVVSYTLQEPYCISIMLFCSDTQEE